MTQGRKISDERRRLAVSLLADGATVAEAARPAPAGIQASLI